MRQSHLVKCVGMSNNKSLLPLPRLSLDIGVLHRPGIGIGFFLLGITCQTIMEANAKWLAQDYPVGQVAFFRSLLAFLPIAILVSFSGGLSALKTARLAMQVLRGVVMTATILLFFAGLRYMPLAEASAIILAAPLIMTALAAPLLGERVGIGRWSAICLGFGGVLLILQPSSEVFRIESLLLVAAALFYALAMIATRNLARTDTISSIVVYGNLIIVLASALTLPFGWVPPAPADLQIFLLMGLSGGFGTFFLVLSFRFAPVNTLAPFDYTKLILAIGIGYLVWRDLPGLWVWIGAAIVVGAALYVVHCETASEKTGPLDRPDNTIT